MHNDSVQFSTSGSISQNNSPASPVKFYQCSHCPFTVKSKAYLFEHLNKVHNFDVDAALKNSGLKSNISTTSGSDFKCQCCDFIACSQIGLNDHLSQCPKKSEVPGLTGSHTNDKKPDTKITVVSSFTSSCSKLKSGVAASKLLKIYTKPTQTITKFLVTTSKSTEKSNTNNSQGSVIVEEASSSSKSNRSGVLQVNTPSSIDINHVRPYSSLQNDELWIATLNKPKTKEGSEEEPPNNGGKRINSDSLENDPVKKPKLHTENATVSEKENTSKSKSYNSSDFSFELSEDEGETKRSLAHVNSVYFCKHCDYNDVGIRSMSSHYKHNHPYIRSNAIYIQDSSDQSATFRCLECPVEFVTTAGLKKHYKEDHPDAPNVFTKKSSELNLVFKCFLCPFTSTVLKNLKDHHDETHPKHEVSNSLWYCRYSVTGSTKESTQLSKQEIKPQAEKMEDSTPENGCLSQSEVESTTSNPPQPTANLALFKCSNCTFSHKSVVVMHVHYQRSHPEEAMTIDTIKQLARLKAHAAQPMTPEKSEDKKSAPLKSPSEPLKEVKTEPSPQKDISVGTCQSKSPNEASKRKNSKKPSIKRDQVFAQAEHKWPPTTIETFYCRFCAFESDSLRSVVGHQNAKHFMHPSANSDAICKYSAKMQKMKAQRQSEMSEIVPSSRSETHKKIVRHGEAERDTCPTEDPAYADPKKLFFCSKCNYANPSLKGIKYHQIKMHNGFFSEERIIQYSALVCKELDGTKSQPRELPFSTHLPLPLIHKRDRHKFFCHFCNYRHGDVALVMKHYRTVHHGCHVKRTDINMYTSMVLKKGKKLRLKARANDKMNGESQDEAEEETKLSKTSTGKSPPQRTLECCACPYRTQYIYLLRRHFAKVHDKKQPVAEILKDCFKQGALQSGYHCEYCLFTHKNGTTLYKHYKDQHPERKLSLNYVLTQLCIGPPASCFKNKPLEVTNAGLNGDAGLPSGQSEAKTYPCSECSFKGGSLTSVIEHFRTDHPWTETHSRVEDVSDTPPPPLDSFREPLDSDWSVDEDEEEEESPSGVFQCPFCPAVMKTHHGLSTHCGLKHQDDVSDTVGSTKQVETQIRAYKCQHCSYVNTSYQGAQAHGKKKHFDLTASPDSINVSMAQVQNLDSLKRDLCGMWKFSAHICTTCLLLYRTICKLDRHRLKDHSGTAVDTAQSSLTAASRPPIKCKIILPKIHAAQMLKMSKAFLSKKGYSVLRCQHCSYTSTTSVKLNQHVRVQHSKYAVSKGSLYKCVLCSTKYFKRKHLAGHYVMKHGKDAYLTHFVPAYMQPKLTAASSASSSSQNHSESSTSKGESTIQIYKCLLCPYVNVSYHGTLTHCQMKHPKVTVRADMLQTDKIPLTSIVSGKKGRYSKQGGYMCKKCSQVCASTAKFKLHCQTRCRGTLDKSKIRAPLSFHRSTLDIEMKEEKSEVEIDAGQNLRLDYPEMKSLPSLATQNAESKIYKCHMCQYSGTHRRYLYGHYRNFHKLHTEITLKLLQKYNKQKHIKTPGLLQSVKAEEISHNKCVKCPEMTFDSPELLLEHYCTLHGSDVKLDFTVLSTGEKKKSTGLYRCSHCFKQLNGIRKLTVHMMSHKETEKEKAGGGPSLPGSAPDPGPIEPGAEDAAPTLASVDEFSRRSVPPADLPTSPDAKHSAPEPHNKRHACRQCGRSFMSPKVLLSHERSHSTVAAIKNFSNLSIALDSSFSKYVIYKAGNTRPFTCSICNYRTTVLGLWWSHFQKRHQDVIVDPTKAVRGEAVVAEDSQNVEAEPLNVLMLADNSTDPGDKPAATQNSMYLEPPDVRRQLSHYNVVAHRNAEELRSCTDSLLHCEMCSFNTEHLSSIKRHYLNRHGKKIIRCKQCDFFTESRKVLEMHMKLGHSTCQSVPTHLKDLRCPFCLYQTKNKNNMIDHIDLHRDKRVVPIEVRRPKLSRYLQGVVFRCHRCTFMSGSVENLRLHMARHDGVRPYKCRLCFFDCTQLSALEAHLSDKHQVERNHELVGQVSLDQLEMSSVRLPDVEQGPLSNLELCGNHSEDEDVEEPLTDCRDALQAGNQNQGQEAGGEENPHQKTLVEQEKHTSDPQAGISSARGQDDEDGDGTKTCMSPEGYGEDQADAGGDGDGETDESSATYSNTTDEEKTAEAQRAMDIDTSVEDDILRNILVLDEDSSVCRTFNKSNPDASPSGGQDDVAQSQNRSIPILAKICPTQAHGPEAETSSSSEPETLPPSILPSSCDGGFPTCVEQERSGRNGGDTPDACREMPVLENEFLKEKMRLLESCEEEKDGDRLEQEDDKKSFKDSPDELRENDYSCELCGRRLASSSELKLHVVRHGM